MKKQSSDFLVLPLKLLIIASSVVLILALVNYVTKDKIAENNAKKINAAIEAMFPNSTSEEISYTGLSDADKKTVENIYAVKQDGYLSGYCFNIKVTGFGGEINMIVGIGTDGKVVDTDVISHSETPSIGASAINGNLPALFKKASLETIDGISGISGATITSSAVKGGIKTAVKIADNLFNDEEAGT